MLYLVQQTGALAPWMNSWNKSAFEAQVTQSPCVWYSHSMKTTIDKAGRVVIPAAIRSQADLRPGTELEIILDDFSIRLVRAVPGPKIVRKGNRLVARPTAPPENRPHIDLARLVEEERNRWPW